MHVLFIKDTHIKGHRVCSEMRKLFLRINRENNYHLQSQIGVTQSHAEEVLVKDVTKRKTRLSADYRRNMINNQRQGSGYISCPG